MLKKLSRMVLAGCLLGASLFICLGHTYAVEAEQDLAPHAVSAVLMDAGTGKVLFEKNPHLSLPPASITKLMTMLLVMEAVGQGKITLKDPVRVSEHAASMGGTQIFLEPGEQMSVHDMLKGVAIASANDASVALAEFLGGTEGNFVRMMNERARQLGMKNTHFQNANGLPAKNHYSSAYDIALLSREILKYPLITKFTGIYQDYLRQGSKKPFWLVNTNKLVRYYQGVDGLKTGYTSEARFCLAATAKREGLRLVSVVMGEPDAKTRNAEVAGMFDYAFNQYTSHTLYKKGDVVAVKKIEKGDHRTLVIRANQPITILVKKGEHPQSYKKKWTWTTLQAPIKPGQSLGKIQIEKEGQVVQELELVSTVEIKRANLWTSIKQAIGEVLFLPDELKETE
ncbi:D-alanyl-D-alanine carboxypeptidase family protein [Laceyella putida]|uniref:serine-type D-Ala-D-Ala carboxypeptidase n=1 Tax=Laceyella putida TaxID=110101 RepID=A0ABW2RJD5_9BACL